MAYKKVKTHEYFFMNIYNKKLPNKKKTHSREIFHIGFNKPISYNKKPYWPANSFEVKAVSKGN